jgi:ATP-dependent RNA helicase DDX51/DBP6
LAQVLAATRPPSKIPERDDGFSFHDTTTGLPRISYSDACAPAFMPYPSSPYVEKRESSCQKLLFSATLTRDPGKIAALDLRDPKYFIVGANKTTGQDGDVGIGFALERFTMPSSLTVNSFFLPVTSDKY